MGIRAKTAISIICESETMFGATYYVDTGDGYKALCFRPLKEQGKSDMHCENKAGQGTDHTGEGRCEFHNGKTKAPITHGRYSKVLKRHYKKQYESLIKDPDLLNLVPELALQRTLLMDSITRFQEGHSPMELRNAIGILRDVGQTVERIEKIHSQKILTVAAWQLAMTRALDVGGRFISEEQMPMFVLAWRNEVMLEGELV